MIQRNFVHEEFTETGKLSEFFFTIKILNIFSSIISQYFTENILSLRFFLLVSCE